MEILFVSHKYPPAVGGMEKQSFELIHGMEKLAKVHSIVYTGTESRLAFFFSLEKRILDMCGRFPGISVIHFNDALIATFCLRHQSYTHLFRAVTVHGLDIVFPNRIYQKRILPAFNRFDLIIAVSQATANACIARGINAEKVRVVHNGVDHMLIKTKRSADFIKTFEAQHGISLEGKVILTILGRPVKRKGFSWFIENVVPRLQGNFIVLIVGALDKKQSIGDRLFSLLPAALRNNIELALGYPTDQNQIRKLLLEKQYEKKVRHLGKLSSGELEQILAASEALIVPNISVNGDMEGFGLVCLEASLCGAWVFASGIDGITDAVHPGKNGTLLAPGDQVAWANALNDFIANPAAFNPDPEAARSYTQAQFGWKKMVGEYLDLFQKAGKH